MATKPIAIKKESKTKQLDNNFIWLIMGLFIFVATLFYFYKSTNIGLKNTLIEQHGYRQTQTGLTALYFIKEGFKIDYITPMFGYPWKVPMEFPMYQYFVAAYKVYSGKNLDIAGRIVSIAFLYLSLIPVFFIGKLFTNKVSNAIWLLPCIIIHPLTIYWSRSFLIESTALFFNLLYVWVGLELLYKQKIWLYMPLILLGVIAPISKSTTGLIHIICLGIFYLFHLLERFKWENIKNEILFYLPKGLVAFVIPLVSTIVWTKWTDQIKVANFTSDFWASSDPVMQKWNFGTLEQKLSLDVWKQIDGFEFHFIIILIILLAISVSFRVKYWKEIVAFTVSGLAGPLIFTNLYYVHDYYSFANTVFYAVAIGFFVVSTVISGRNIYERFAGIAFSVALSYYTISAYPKSSYLSLQKNNNPYFKTVGQNLQNYLKDGENFVFFGMIGDPFVPYYAERKGVCMSPHFVEEMKNDTLGFLKKIEASQIKAIVVCDVNNQDLKLVQKMIEYFKLSPQPVNTDIQQMGYYIFTSKQ